MTIIASYKKWQGLLDPPHTSGLLEIPAVNIESKVWFQLLFYSLDSSGWMSIITCHPLCCWRTVHFMAPLFSNQAVLVGVELQVELQLQTRQVQLLRGLQD